MGDSNIKKGGFTLVELLVVVAIIGLLVSLSLIAIEYYRRKAQDARITATLSQMRTVSAQIYSDENSYFNICSEGILNSSYSNLQLIKLETEKINGGVSPSCSLSDDSEEYCVSSPLMTSGTLCVDSSGYVGDDLSNCEDGRCQ